MNAKDVCEMFVESFYSQWFEDLSWREVLKTEIDCCSDETWGDLFKQYPDAYECCRNFHRIRKIFI